MGCDPRGQVMYHSWISDRGTSRAEWTQYGLFSAVELGAGSSWPVYIGAESWQEKQQPGDDLVMHMLCD